MASKMSPSQTSPLQVSKYVLEAVKMEQSLFALPFAYIGMLLAQQSFPGIPTLLWITVAMMPMMASISNGRVVNSA